MLIREFKKAQSSICLPEMGDEPEDSKDVLRRAKGVSMELFVQLRKMKILLIDDDEWIRDSLTLFFESEQCQLIALETAEEGLNALSNQRYDIIISDYWLPGMNGLDFFKSIKNFNKNAIKILITAYGSPGVVDEARKAGVHSLIAKPFTSDTVEAVLSRLIIDQKGQGSNTDEEETE